MSERRITEDQEVPDRNFRSSYYQSLGFKDSEKSITHLEALLKADVFDVKRLKLFCLKHTLTVSYRPLVWKIILGVIPVFSDTDTCSFVKEQKKMEFRDLKSALQVMGRIRYSAMGTFIDEGGEAPVLYEFSSKSGDSSLPSTLPTLHLLPSFHPHSLSSTSEEKLGPKSVAEFTSNQSTVLKDCRTLLQSTICTSRDFVLIFLLENKRLLSISVSQLKQEEQVNMLAIAEAFLVLFEEESEDEIYWLFSNFMKKLESLSSINVDLFDIFSRTLEDIDCALLEHIKDLDAVDKAFPIQRWFRQCYASYLPESCLGSVWDRVIGGSTMILVYIAVCIVLSIKRRIFSFSSIQQIEHLLDTIPQDNYGAIVGKAIELWEANGSPLLPSAKMEDSPSHELHNKIEDYT